MRFPVLLTAASALLLSIGAQAQTKLTDYVNPMLGTATLWETEDLGYERQRMARPWGAETFPGSSVPNAMVQLTPVTMYHSGSGYQYEDKKIFGFAHTVPLFDKVEFTFADGKVLSIVRKGEGEKITGIRCNGKKVSGWFVQDADLKKGGRLEISVK